LSFNRRSKAGIGCGWQRLRRARSDDTQSGRPHETAARSGFTTTRTVQFRPGTPPEPHHARVSRDGQGCALQLARARWGCTERNRDYGVGDIRQRLRDVERIVEVVAGFRGRPRARRSDRRRAVCGVGHDARIAKVNRRKRSRAPRRIAARRRPCVRSGDRGGRRRWGRQHGGYCRHSRPL
jgi:hypothetical protein